MSKVSNELPASASNNESLILQALNASNQRQVAEKVGIDASTLSRMKNDKKNNGLTEIEFISFLLTAIGLKVVQESDVYCSPEIAEATRVYLAHAFTSPEYMRILFK
ncbi:hypothetical protein [Acinetobacter phage A785.1]|uniref:helix-turn-helix domain-containing protein n=2 Tax=Acinetobacter baumannii TaxID=470 RepID=UPI0009E0FDEB|nr:helix-turn-helix transcriptional regulator [Acinetobacter baumannii]WMT10778.1 hypothetical protein [Acinetobacter phage A785.1]ARG13842.1 transcriptional regulator [Acinetobacter baumannii]RQL53776.1 hypothetical protein BJI59_19300 [Acinetobacter baumannii]RSZ93827.1 XRE family transcriptional regulator [Acinetobacter baumannii]USX63433.1 helix-turn-helix domain-containing protein [Acinetobacter baumannii]